MSSVEVIPDGWTYEWKTAQVYGQDQQSRMLEFRRTGWEEVPTRRHPEMMPLGTSEPFIIRKGMILMERPLEITQEMKRRDDKNARDAVRQKADQLGQAPPGTFQRQDAKGGNLAKVSVGYESGVMIPD